MKRKIRIACVSDLHLLGKGIIFEDEQHELFEVFLWHIKNDKIDHLLICGDIVRSKGDPRNAKHFNKLISMLIRYGYYHYNKCTFIPGNHDYSKWGFRGVTVTPKSKLHYLMDTLNHNKPHSGYTAPFYKIIGPISIIGINTIDTIGGTDGGFMTSSRIKEFNNILNMLKKRNIPIIVASHHELQCIGSFNLDLSQLKNWNVKLMVFGHDHDYYRSSIENVPYYCVGKSVDSSKYMLIEATDNTFKAKTVKY